LFIIAYKLNKVLQYCKDVGRTKTDVLRELIRTLKEKKKPS